MRWKLCESVSRPTTARVDPSMRCSMKRRCCHKPVTLSTSPRAAYTHWKQTVLYLDEVLVVNAGESLEGEIAVRRNEKNHRDVDIDLRVSLNGEHGSYDLTQQYKLR